MDEEQGLSSPIGRGIRGIRRSISSNIFGGRQAPQVQGDSISSNLIAKNSLALSNVSMQLGGISDQVKSINSSLTVIKDNLAISDDIERKKELAKRKREAQLAEQGLREGKESDLEKKIQFALLSPVRRVANVARGILGRLGEALLYLAGGWLTSQALTFLQLNSEGNIDALKKFKDRFIKDLLLIGGLTLGFTVGFGKILGLVKGLGLLLTRVTFGGFLFKAFGGLGQFILGNISKFINFIRRVGIGGLARRGLGLRNLLPIGFLFQNRIARGIRNFFQGAGDEAMQIPFFKNMMDRFSKTGMGRGLDKFSKSGGFSKLLNKSFIALFLALDTFSGQAELQQAGLKPFQALITSFSRAFGQLAMFTAFVNSVSFAVGGLFAGVGALLGLMGGPFALLTSGAGAAAGFSAGKIVGTVLGILGFFFPGTTKKLTGGLIDIEKFSKKVDKYSTDVGMRVAGVDEETQEKVRGKVFKKNNNEVSQNVNSNGIEISSLTVDDTSKGIVPFKRENNNLALNDNTANIINASEGGSGVSGGTSVAGGSDDGGGVDNTPIIDSLNSNDNQHLTAILNMNLNLP